VSAVLADASAVTRTVPLSDAVEFNPKPQSGSIAEELEVSFVPMAAVEAGSGRMNPTQARPYREVKRGFTYFSEGDVLFAKITPCMENGKMAVARGLRNGIGFGSTEFHVLRPRDGVDARYVYHFVSSATFRREAAHHMTGAVGQKRVPLSHMRQSELPLPPIAEQRRIVAEIENQFSRLDEAVANLQRVKSNLKRYKAGVLKAAIEGNLVATETKLACHGDRPYETGDALLHMVLEQRRARWTGRGKYKEPEPPRDEWQCALPSGWAWATLGHIALSVKDGPHYSPKYADDGVPFISGGNIRPEGIDFSSVKFITSELHTELSKRCRPEPGDLLYTKGGTTGVARINTESREFNVWVHVAVIKLSSLVHPFYVQHALNSGHCYRQAQQYTHGVGNQDLGLTRMIRITIPLPPRAEQERIVAEVDHRLSIVRKVEAEVDANLRRAQALRQAVLRRSFGGPAHASDSSPESTSPAPRMVSHWEQLQ
jgi:type I restriction enzyme S subunit